MLTFYSTLFTTVVVMSDTAQNCVPLRMFLHLALAVVGSSRRSSSPYTTLMLTLYTVSLTLVTSILARRMLGPSISRPVTMALDILCGGVLLVHPAMEALTNA